jgi:two-component system chemotaxis response regulator CheY
MLKAVIVDANAISRGLLNTVLTDGGYKVVGQTHTPGQGYALLQKFEPHFFCIAREQVEEGSNIVEQIRATYPKTLVLMMSGNLDAPTIQAAVQRGVHGFIVKPFKGDAVLKTIRTAVLNMVKKQQEQAP